MKIIKKNVYYCDFCGKRSLSKGHMNTHESHCTANPNRECRLCGVKSIADLIEDLKKRFSLEPKIQYDEFGSTIGETFSVVWTGEPVTLDELRKRTDNCPNCMLAIMRQCKFNYHYFNENDEFEFDYKAESQRALSEKLEIEREGVAWW
jgi:hypothetical protein